MILLKIFFKKIPFIYHFFVLLYKFLNRKNYNSYLAYCDIHLLSCSDYENTFFGYYDISPFNGLNSNLILTHCNRHKPNQRPSTKMPTDIILYNMRKKTWRKVDTTFAWNWQQGSRLQWLDDDSIIYNFYKNDFLYAKSYNIKTNDFKNYPTSINAIYRNVYGLTLDYVALSEFTEYGYSGIHIKNRIDGILYLEFKTRKIVSLLTEKDIINKIDQSIISKFSKGHINHISISPNGSTFIFIYRGVLDNKRSDFLFCYSLQNGELELIVANKTISHYTWKDNDTLICWAILNQVSGYYSIDLQSKNQSLLFNTNQDGHPTILKDGRMITDTYSDKNSNQHLYCYNFHNQEVSKILSIYHTIFYNKYNRCDLHPSINAEDEKFQVDTRYKNKRQIIIGNIL